MSDEGAVVRDVELERCYDLIDRWFAAADDIPEELKAELTRFRDQFVERRQFRAATAPVRPGQLGASYWAIRTDQLDLAKNLAPVAVPIVTFASSSLSSAATASPFAAAAVLIWSMLLVAGRFRRKRVDLDSDHFRVLMALKHHGPLTIDALHPVVNGITSQGATALSEGRIEALLSELKAISARDGTVEALVAQAANKTWTANGV